MKLKTPIILTNINYQKLIDHNQRSKNMNREEVPIRSPPPPPPRFLGFRRSYNHHNANIPTLKRPLCRLSHPNHPHTLHRIRGGHTKLCCFSCGEREESLIRRDQDFNFSCSTCKVEFHNGCHKFPRKVTHPYHLQHPLTFTFRNFETGTISDGKIDESFANTILSNSYTFEAKTSDLEKSGSIRSQSDILFDKCTWCGDNIKSDWFYRCSICNFCLDLSCSQNIPLLTVTNPKSHQHSLLFYPRPLLTPCDACGLVNALEPSYACFQCNYMVHGSCIDLPRVIKITRHQHRIFHTPYPQPITSLCRVCYKTVDIKYGQYSCNQENCSYVVHSKCATHKNVWDGKELEWEPEEPDESEDIAPFIRVGSDMIKHFSHEHILKLEKYDGVRDAEKQCQACILPISSDDFYNCMHCDFFLHEVCAGLLRKLDHALHVHPLVLEPPPQSLRYATDCSVCSRKFTGFMYKCSKEDCMLRSRFQVDVRCILVPDYFTHNSHEHPLFISTSSYKGDNKICCKVCKNICLETYLQCSVCEFAMCYECTTIPNEVSYKYDKHPLSLCYGEEVSDGIYWCEVCEKEVNPKDWFYTCNECCITVHIQCIFGSSAYMKPGFSFRVTSSKMEYFLSKVEVIRNGTITRPFCDRCGHRCPGTVYYKKYRHDRTLTVVKVKLLCSLYCLEPKWC